MKSVIGSLSLGGSVAFSLVIYLPGQAFAQALPDKEISPQVINIPPEGGACSSESLSAAPVRPDKFAANGTGVDMRSGALIYSHVDLSIGDENGLSLERVMAPMGPGTAQFRSTFGSMTDKWDIYFRETRIKVCEANDPTEYDYQVSVNFGSLGSSFRSTYDPETGTFNPQNRPADAELALDVQTSTGVNRPTKYYYIAGDGTKVTSLDLPTGIYRVGAGVQDVLRPDGTFINFQYGPVATGLSKSDLRAVVSSRGYAILYEYVLLASEDWRVSKACAMNLAYDVLPALGVAAVCPTGVPTSTYSYDSAGELIRYVDQSGVGTNLGAGGSALYQPGEVAPYVTNSISVGSSERIVNSQTFIDGRHIEYEWTRDQNYPVSSVMGGKYTENGNSVEINYSKWRDTTTFPIDPTWYVTPGPTSVKDQNGHIWQFSYCYDLTSNCHYEALYQATDPSDTTEGTRRRFYYGAKDRLTRTDYVPKPGSNLPTRSETKSYGCTAAVCQRKPTSVTDANGNTTTYTYSTDHGGVLTEVGPAVNGVPPAKKYSYGQFYAWLKASGGGYVQAATPVWLLTEERSCNSSALDLSAGTCAAGSSDLVKTTYEYQQGSATKGSNMLLMGVAVTSGSTTLRTCYGYDEWGRKISETSPKANLASCQ